MEPLLTLLRQNGVQITQPSPDTLCVSGKLLGQSFQIAANVSSQFVSGMLLALPLLGGGTVRLMGVPESVSYVRMTMQTMETRGAPSQRIVAERPKARWAKRLKKMVMVTYWCA